MKIGEISMNINTRSCNYGSILHSWAFQYYLKKYEGIEVVETIDYIRKDLEKWNRSFPMIEGIRKGNIKRTVKLLLGYPAYYSRLKKVDRFIKNNMSISGKRYLQADLKSGRLGYDLLVADSDTIWAPRRNGEFDDGYFLNLPAMEDIKRISYAPSMGNARVNDEQKIKLRKLLSHFAHISCRETYERELLSCCTEKEVAKVLDPVMLLKKTDWEELIARNYSGEKYHGYILVYQPVDESPVLEKCAQIFAEKNHLQTITITIKDKVMGYRGKAKIINNCSPEEFLYLIRHSEAVFTNSFHAICFSMIFEKDFYAFSREDDKKVKDICKISGLEYRFFEKVEDYKESSIDYGVVRDSLMPQIVYSKQWLHNAIFN